MPDFLESRHVYSLNSVAVIKLEGFTAGKLLKIQFHVPQLSTGVRTIAKPKHSVSQNCTFVNGTFHSRSQKILLRVYGLDSEQSGCLSHQLYVIFSFPTALLSDSSENIPPLSHFYAQTAGIAITISLLFQRTF